LFASKGTIVTPNQNRVVTNVRAFIDGGAGHTYKCVIATLSSANPGVITGILADSGTQVVTTQDTAVDFAFSGGVPLVASTPYAFIIVRTEGTPTTSSNLVFATANGDEVDPTGVFALNGSVRYASNNPTVGDSTYFNNSFSRLLITSAGGPLVDAIVEGVGGGGGATTFTGLTDTPANYTGQGGKAVAVKPDATGLEFVDFPEGGGSMTGAQIEAALDTHLGDETWKEGLATPANLNALSDVDIDTSLLTEDDHGAAITFDYTSGLWVAGRSGFNTLRLGGGMELIYENTNLAALSQITLNELTYGIDKYDEIIVYCNNVTGQVRIRTSSDAGATWLPIAYWRITSDTSGDGTVVNNSEGGPVAGGITNNLAGTYAILGVKNHSDPNLHTEVYAEGGSINDVDGATSQRGFTVSTALINAINIYSINASGFFGTGSIRIVGVKKSRQPLEYYGRLTGSPSVSGSVTLGMTLGCKFRAGTIGKAIVDQAPGVDMTVVVRNAAAVVIATGVIFAAETECDLIASSPFTVTDSIVGFVVTGGTDAEQIDFIVRGEVA
jgi:hypothetical protein